MTYIGRLLLCLVLFLGGLGCLYLTSSINYEQGLSLGQTEAAKSLFSYSSLAVDVIGVGLLAFVAGVFIRQGNKLAACGTLAAVAGFSLYSMTMFYGFGATHRMAPAQVQAQHQAKVASKRATQSLKSEAAKKDHINFLRDLAKSNMALSNSRRLGKQRRAEARDSAQAVLDRLGQVAFASPEVTVAPPAQTIDPQAKFIAEDVGVEVMTVQKVLTLSLGLLLVLCKTLCFMFSTALWPKREAKQQFASSESTDSGSDEHQSGVFDNASEVTSSNVTLVVDNDAKPEDDVASLAQKLRPTVEEAINIEEQVLDFIDDQTVPAQGGFAVRASEAYYRYRDWANSQGIENPITQNLFGRTLVRLNDQETISWPRVNQSGTIYYLDRAFRGEGELAA
jgi:hypothetical protein